MYMITYPCPDFDMVKLIYFRKKTKYLLISHLQIGLRDNNVWKHQVLCRMGFLAIKFHIIFYKYHWYKYDLQC